MGKRQNFQYDIDSIYSDELTNDYIVYPEKDKYILGIGLTSQCNFKCPFCYYHSNNIINNNQDIPLKILQTIFKNCNNLQCVNFALEGEPFCYPYFFQALDLAMYAAKSITISTNASLLTHKNLQKLSKYNISLLSLSIDAGDKKNMNLFVQVVNFPTLYLMLEQL